jgi:hypothetical protein
MSPEDKKLFEAATLLNAHVQQLYNVVTKGSPSDIMPQVDNVRAAANIYLAILPKDQQQKAA